MKILVVGIGGIGGFFGGFLHESGADVTFLVRPKRKKIVSENGLKIYNDIFGETCNHTPDGKSCISKMTIDDIDQQLQLWFDKRWKK